MAVEIPEEATLAPNTILVVADKDETNKDLPIGRVKKRARSIDGGSTVVTSLFREIPDPNQPPDPEAPVPPPIGVETAKIVFNINNSQEVVIDGVDYYIVKGTDILEILPDPYEEL
ncbi:MAG: hypothetical protein ACYS30_22940 [Planctomycetota bacterium]|jgi:hypothetical protein